MFGAPQILAAGSTPELPSLFSLEFLRIPQDFDVSDIESVFGKDGSAFKTALLEPLFNGFPKRHAISQALRAGANIRSFFISSFYLPQLTENSFSIVS